MEVHFLMAKLTREEKIDIYNKRRNGVSFKDLSLEYKILTCNIKYLVSLVDYHGVDILRDETNRHYSKELKQEIINKVLIDDQSVYSTAIEYGLTSNGMLYNWIKYYKENNYVIVEKKKGAQPKTMTKEDTKINKKNTALMNAEEELKHWKNKALKLEAENEYLKKLSAVIQKKKQQQKKK